MTKKDVWKFPAFLEFEDNFFNTTEVTEKILKVLKKFSGLTNKDISNRLNLPIEIIKKGIKILEKTKQIKIHDPEKNPMEMLISLGYIPDDKKNKKKS